MPVARAREAVVSFRAAVAARDHGQLLALLGDDAASGFLQEAGECFLAWAEQEPRAITAVAELLSARLRQRSWPGDAELAELITTVASESTGGRRQIRADLDMVADVLEGSELGWGGVLDVETGSAWPEEVLTDWPMEDDPPDPDDDPERYLSVPTEGSRAAWEDMRDFAAAVEDERVRERLLDAIDGKGAFSRFRRVLDQHERLASAWYSYSAEACVGRAREWLAGEGYDALPPRH